MGEVFAGRYELIDPIGRGGVGAVWRAWDQRRRRYVAAKVLQQSDAHTLLRFVREQAVRIDHPHVLAPASWAADDDKVLFTMDLVHGGSLAHLVGDYGPLPPNLVCVLLDQLLSGLTAVHAEGVVHRDIKPANILLEATGTGRPHVRLSDFGISMRKGEPRLTDANYVVGTPGYFAPEQMLGAEPDFPGDLFAVGLVAVHLLTGSKPDTQGLVEHFAQYGTPDAPEGIAEPLWQVLANLLQPDPDLRFKTAAGARKALLAAAELLPEATIEDEIIEVFDHIGPLPAGFGPDGPLRPKGERPKGERPKGHPSEGDRPEGEGAGSDPRAGMAGSRAAAEPGAGAGTSVSTGTGTGVGTGTGAPEAAPPFPEAPARGGNVSPPPPSVPPFPSTPPPSATDTSDNGDFPLAPPSTGLPAPQRPVPQPHTGQAPVSQHPVPQHRPPLQAPPQHPTPQQPTSQPTRPYTPDRPHPLPSAGRAPGRRHRALPQRRPGPPPKVAVPVIVVALLCIAVGVWALAVS
ncbi:serine/threonine protein kinase [Streptomyces albofaciens JCM 4342]|uniref:protein kinase domain-containing protein n=1 Tax=Streptomyces albofaciens TaxID=66866 RepID=UPI001238E957|nr:serine/threonine-protein kinase [Streptomyces albofaciens]KAA6220786.1 serine/threonine protein kinase [Streptomyces albofaciens JCM 4342]